MLIIRNYKPSDWNAIEQIHDSARKTELRLAGLEDAFLPLKIAAAEEGLFDYPGLFVAELEGRTVGFAACTKQELAWLYVHPDYMGRGIGKRLVEYAIRQFPGICHIEVLAGNRPAQKLYESLGFAPARTETGQMPGNERFTVTVTVLKRAE